MTAIRYYNCTSTYLSLSTTAGTVQVAPKKVVELEPEVVSADIHHKLRTGLLKRLSPLLPPATADTAVFEADITLGTPASTLDPVWIPSVFAVEEEQVESAPVFVVDESSEEDPDVDPVSAILTEADDTEEGEEPSENSTSYSALGAQDGHRGRRKKRSL